MFMKSFNEWKMEEVDLKEEFNYSSISQARSDFRKLVLTRMRMDAKLHQVDFKDIYLGEAVLYNPAIPSYHVREFSPIRTEVVVPLQSFDVDATVERDREEDEVYEASRDVPMPMTPREVG